MQQNIPIINKEFPSVFLSNQDTNPTLSSDNSPFEIQFYMTKESMMDVEDYKNFLENAISRFRKSRTYKNYKHFLITLGLDRCQIHGNITSEMATIEMHHNMLTVFDIALIICGHVLNTKGKISTFDLVDLLKKEHTEHRVQLVMLSLTPHQLYHNTEDLYVPPDMCIGKWDEFLDRYKLGVTKSLAFKIIYYLKQYDKGIETNDILKLRDNLIRWSDYNEQLDSDMAINSNYYNCFPSISF